MKLPFYKYQGTGNDFVMIDNRQSIFNKNNTTYVKQLCDRRFGIGADGLILLEHDDTSDFKMVYFNADGNQSTMCGNGGRCIVHFAHFLGIINSECSFTAIDGLHHASIKDDTVTLQMQDVFEIITKENNAVFLNTGSPHHVIITNKVDTIDVNNKGSIIRNSETYKPDGCNVNFVEQLDNTTFKVRTYERGVEAETLSCGTGVTATALAMHYQGKTTATSIHLQTKGGELTVHFKPTQNGYQNIWLTGKATQVYTGEI